MDQSNVQLIGHLLVLHRKQHSFIPISNNLYDYLPEMIPEHRDQSEP